MKKKKRRRTNRCCLDLNHHSLAQVLDSIRYDKNDVSHRGAKGLIFMFRGSVLASLTFLEDEGVDLTLLS